MAKGLKLAPAEAGDLRAVIRLNLGAWQERISKLRLILPHESELGAVAFTPDGRFLLTASGRRTKTVTLRRWDAVTGRQLGEPLSYNHAAIPRVVVFNPDHSLLLIGYEDGLVRFVNTWDGAPRHPA